jgi:hypothetical protein
MRLTTAMSTIVLTAARRLETQVVMRRIGPGLIVYIASQSLPGSLQELELCSAKWRRSVSSSSSSPL